MSHWKLMLIIFIAGLLLWKLFAFLCGLLIMATFICWLIFGFNLPAFILGALFMGFIDRHDRK